MKKVIITKDNIEEIIAKQNDGSADINEIEAIREWRAKSKNNEEHYLAVLQTNAFYANMEANQVDVDKAWENIRTRMKKPQISVELNAGAPVKRLEIIKWVGYAASIILVVSIGLLLNNSESQSQYNTTDIAMSHKLEDGSVIELGNNSALSKISKYERVYNFSGEAEFKIIHDDAKPFVVHMKDIIVKDLGTVFHIKALPMNDTVFVKVTEGEAQFYTLSHAGLILEQGEEGMYIKSKNKFYKRSIDVENQFLSITFENASFGDRKSVV